WGRPQPRRSAFRGIVAAPFSEPLPTAREALDEPLAAFPSWFMRITCDRCGQQRMFSETHAAGQRGMLIRDIIARMRHDGCGGRAGKVELLTGTEGSRRPPVRRHGVVGGFITDGGFA